MKNYWKYIGLRSQDIKDHYDHKIIVRKGKFEGSAPCKTILGYVLFCDDCKEDILCRVEGEKGYKCLEYLFQKQELGCKLSFDRIGGYYGKIGYTKDYEWVAVAESTDLY